MKFEIEVEGVKELVTAFEKVQDGVADLRKNAIWLKVQQAFYREVKDHFAGEGTGQSGKWKELSSPYKEWKAKKWGAVPILQASGKMYKSLTREGADAIVDKQPLEMTLGTKVKYAKYHQGGTKKMPARPVYDFTQDQKRKIVQPVQDGLRQLIANARLKG
jgi:phage gpG-like protein